VACPKVLGRSFILLPAAAAGAAIVAACSLVESAADTSASLADPDPGATADAASDAGSDADAGWPRLCPSTRADDGGWVAVDGIDVSDWQYSDWDQIARAQPSLRYGFARVSSGLIRVDQRFGQDWAGMKRAGLIRGPYQYFTPRYSAVAQADLFVQRLTDEGGLAPEDLPPVLDVETTEGMPDATVSCRIKLWMVHAERALHRRPMIYTSYLWSAYFDATFARYPLWVTNFVGTPTLTCPRMPLAWNKWVFWQHSAVGAVPGVYVNSDRDDGGAIGLVDGGDAGELAETDLDFFDGTLDELRAFVATTASSGVVDDPPPLDAPPHVSVTAFGPDFDCADGCCIADP
jgi:lysozyme